MEYVILGIACALVLGVILWTFYARRKRDSTYGEPKKISNETVEVKKDDLEELTNFIRVAKEQVEEEQRIKSLKKAEQKQKLETFKQTKEELKERLKNQIQSKEWKSLEQVLNSADKGSVGIYIMYNATKDKYYVGQAKQLVKRVKDHFRVEDIARDFMSGDAIQVKFLTAAELGEDYRLDHVEKTGIEIFASDKSGYNKNVGNL